MTVNPNMAGVLAEGRRSKDRTRVVEIAVDELHRGVGALEVKFSGMDVRLQALERAAQGAKPAGDVDKSVAVLVPGATWNKIRELAVDAGVLLAGRQFQARLDPRAFEILSELVKVLP